MGSNPMPGASIGRQSRGEHHAGAEAKTGVVLPQPRDARACQSHLKLGENVKSFP